MTLLNCITDKKPLKPKNCIFDVFFRIYKNVKTRFFSDQISMRVLNTLTERSDVCFFLCQLDHYSKFLIKFYGELGTVRRGID